MSLKSPESLIYYGLILQGTVLIIKTDSRADTRLLAMNGVKSTLNLKSLVSIAVVRNLQTYARLLTVIFYFSGWIPDESLFSPPVPRFNPHPFLRPFARSRNRLGLKCTWPRYRAPFFWKARLLSLTNGKDWIARKPREIWVPSVFLCRTYTCALFDGWRFVRVFANFCLNVFVVQFI